MANSLYMTVSSLLRANLIKSLVSEVNGLHFLETDTQKLHPINDLPGIFGTESEAVAFALKAGKGWNRYSTRRERLGKNNDAKVCELTDMPLRAPRQIPFPVVAG